jgi:hypothetical protein
MAETKASPNPNGCLARALPHEPFLVLLARDPVAPAAIRYWCGERMALKLDGHTGTESEQIVEAMQTADLMESWRVEHDGEWREAEAKRAQLIERIARRIAAAGSPEESIDLIWMAHAAEAAAALDEFERMEGEANG